MHRLVTAATAAFALVAFVCVLMAGPPADAQPAPSYLAQTSALAAAVAASGAASAVKGLNVDKTYQVYSSTVSGTGTTVVSIEGSNAQAGPWDNIGTVTLSTSSTVTSGSFLSLDRYSWLRANATTLTGTGAKFTATMGY